MTTAQVEEWVERLKVGALDLTDLRTVEEVQLPDVLGRLRAHFPVQFLERRQRSKWEIGLAQGHRRHVMAAGPQSSRTPVRKRTAATDTFQHCLLLTGESGRLTTVAALSLLRARTPRGEDEPVELSSGAGFSLYRDPDGWKIKLLDGKAVSLSRKALHDRGWQLGPEGE